MNSYNLFILYPKSVIIEPVVSEIVRQITSLFFALRNKKLPPMEIGKIINQILLKKGLEKERLDKAWDQWFQEKLGVSAI